MTNNPLLPTRRTVLVLAEKTDRANQYQRKLSDDYVVQTAFTHPTALNRIAADSTIEVVLLSDEITDASARQFIEHLDENDHQVEIARAVKRPVPDHPGEHRVEHVPTTVDPQQLTMALERLRRRCRYERDLKQYFDVVWNLAGVKPEYLPPDDRARHASLLAKEQELRAHLHALEGRFDERDFEAIMYRFDSMGQPPSEQETQASV